MVLLKIVIVIYLITFLFAIFFILIDFFKFIENYIVNKKTLKEQNEEINMWEKSRQAKIIMEQEKEKYDGRND